FTYDAYFRKVTEVQGDRARLTYTYSPGTASALPASFTAAPFSGPGAAPRVDYVYDSAFHVVSMHWSPAFGDFTISYTPLGQFSSITYPSGQTRSFTYDNQGRLTQVA